MHLRLDKFDTICTFSVYKFNLFYHLFLDWKHARYPHFLQLLQKKSFWPKCQYRSGVATTTFAVFPLYAHKRDFWAYRAYIRLKSRKLPHQQALLQPSRPLGHHSTPELQPSMALPHGQANSLQRNRSLRLLLSSQVGEKPDLWELHGPYALNAIDRAVRFWRSKAVPRPRSFRAPWLWLKTGANIWRNLCRTMHSWCITFIKNPWVMDSLQP